MRRSAITLCVFTFLACATAQATPTVEEITRSFSQNMDQEPDYGRVIPWLFGLAGAVVVVIYFRQRQKREAVPRALNHPGKLLREVVKIAEIDPVEMKRLKLLAAEHDYSSPLTLLLCPSLLAQKQHKAPAPVETERLE
jgi:hypothetical protein